MKNEELIRQLSDMQAAFGNYMVCLTAAIEEVAEELQQLRQALQQQQPKT